MFISRLFPLALAISFVVGCSDKDGGRVEVTGSVKLKTRPIKDGTISFEPLEGQPTRASAAIVAGDFKIPKPNGLVPGKYLVRVSAGDGKTPVNPVDANQPPGPGGGTNIISKELVPSDWNVNSKQERTVAKDGPNRFDIDIP